MSTHEVKVVPVSLEQHPNANSLSIVRVNDYTCVVKTADWQGIDKAVYVEPDYVVPSSSPHFSWLGEAGAKEITCNNVKGYRVKVKKLRGVVSMGLLVPAPPDAQIGDDVMQQFGIARYEPPETLSTSGEAGPAPSGFRPVYDVESARKYAHLFEPGEWVIATEKVHGCNARFCCVNGEMFCGSRTEWKRPSNDNLWWKALHNTYCLREFCEANQDITVYGEIYGWVQDLRYGHGPGEIGFLAFDLRRGGDWVPAQEARKMCPVEFVPTITIEPWDKERFFALAEGPSLVADKHGASHIREGIVVKPLVERVNVDVGRVQLKIVSNAYLERYE